MRQYLCKTGYERKGKYPHSLGMFPSDDKFGGRYESMVWYINYECEDKDPQKGQIPRVVGYKWMGSNPSVRQWVKRKSRDAYIMHGRTRTQIGGVP